ncbi:MAG TPA: flagellar basal body-associated FliL family protein [Caulobacteraceae bacterium]|nr:flagellar basal body-associated FliL family protein [Caulobacteraceae bacterium]
MAKDKSKGKKKGDEAEAPDESAEVEGVEGEGEGEEGGGKKKLPLKLIIIGAAAAVVVLGGGGTAALFLMPHKAAPAAAHKLPPKPKGDKKDGKADPNAPQVQDGPDGVVFYTPPDIVVNMQTPDGKPTFLKLKLTFELPDHNTADTLDAEMPRLNDIFQTFLRELRPEDLSGSEGTMRLRAELQRRVDLVIAPAKVSGVLIEEMLIN